MRDRSRLLITAAVLAVVVAIGAGLAFDGAAKGELCGGSFGPCPPKKPPKAKLRTPGAVKRGDTVTLDASDSTGTIDNYTFHFTLGPGCPAGLTLAHDSEDAGDKPTVDVRLLCSLKVTVTVKGDGKEDTSSSVIAKVKPRKFDPIPFSQNTRANVKLPFTTAQLNFGANRSVDVWVQSGMDVDAADRWLDPGPDLTGTNGAVDMEQLNDPGGPFDGRWWVTGDHLDVNRIIIINSQLLQGGAVYVDNSGSHAKALANIVSATLDHERIHGQLVEKALKDGSVDPLKKLEEAVADSNTDLLDKTNQIIREAETQLKNASSESNVHAAMQMIWGGKTATIEVEEYTGVDTTKTFTLATVGDL